MFTQLLNSQICTPYFAAHENLDNSIDEIRLPGNRLAITWDATNYLVFRTSIVEYCARYCIVLAGATDVRTLHPATRSTVLYSVLRRVVGEELCGYR